MRASTPPSYPQPRVVHSLGAALGHDETLHAVLPVMRLEFTTTDSYDAAARGAHIRRQHRSGHAIKVGLGGYLLLDESELENTVDPLAIAAARAIAVGRANPSSVVSGEAAAVLHDLPLLEKHLEHPVLLTRAWHGRANAWHRVRRAPLRDDEVVEQFGVRCTSVARTITDLAGRVSPPQLLALVDAATRRDPGFTLDPRVPQHRHSLVWVAAHASGRSESIGESISRGLLLARGVEFPHVQATITNEQGKFIARVDFAHPAGVIGEFDGKVKYGALVPVGKTAADVVMEEKRRENKLRALGWTIVRWDWSLLHQPDELTRQVREAIERASALPAPGGGVHQRAVSPDQPRDWETLLGLNASAPAAF